MTRLLTVLLLAVLAGCAAQPSPTVPWPTPPGPVVPPPAPPDTPPPTPEPLPPDIPPDTKAVIEALVPGLTEAQALEVARPFGAPERTPGFPFQLRWIVEDGARFVWAAFDSQGHLTVAGTARIVRVGGS